MRSIRFFPGLERLVNSAAIMCGYACLGLCLLIGYEILARRLLGHSVQGVDELGGYILAITSAVGFSAALMHRMHTRIELGLSRFPVAIQACLNGVAILLLAGFTVFMLLQVWGTWQSSIAYGSRASTPLQTPLWIPQGLWMLGVALFAFVATAMLIHSLWLLVRANYQTLNDCYGPPSLQDEVEKSLAEAESQLESQSDGKGDRL
ncbi:TRAP transporter small permease subunit [Vreelandella olivaria]|uniref:TRAP transporter small permease subunit n=1 Tax=Vreelandella olivaria TaxID=390919 RepID=UPI00201EB89F|nr:TRAP transporter small permease [Halomonas olivaria]